MGRPIGTEGEYAVKVEVAVRNIAGGAPMLRANNAASPGAIGRGTGGWGGGRSGPL